MIKVVIDTNVLVSAAFLHPNSKPSQIVELIISNNLTLCYSAAIMVEYQTVLFRPKFKFNIGTLKLWLKSLTERGQIVNPVPSIFDLPDESDRVFYDVAKACNAYLITGNIKHYPEEPFILTPAQFLTLFENQ